MTHTTSCPVVLVWLTMGTWVTVRVRVRVRVLTLSVTPTLTRTTPHATATRKSGRAG